MSPQSKIVTIFALLLSFLLMPMNATADPNDGNETADDDDHCMEEFWEDGPSGFWMVPVMMGIILFVVLIVFLMGNQSHGSLIAPRTRGVEIVKERYAKGEIDHEEFLRVLEDLKK